MILLEMGVQVSFGSQRFVTQRTNDLTYNKGLIKVRFVRYRRTDQVTQVSLISGQTWKLKVNKCLKLQPDSSLAGLYCLIYVETQGAGPNLNKLQNNWLRITVCKCGNLDIQIKLFFVGFDVRFIVCLEL